jgi:AraC family transcriptional regulator, transcriptional activator of pobA
MVQIPSSPQKLNMRKMYNAFIKTCGFRTKHMYFADSLGIVLDAVGILSPFMFDGQGPYLIEDYRLVLCKKGSLRTIVNLQEVTIGEGMMAIVVPGSIVEPISASDDFTVTGIGVSEERMRMAHNGQWPELLSGKQKTSFIRPTDEERRLADQLFVAMWNLIHGTMVSKPTVDHMVSVITYAFSDIFHRHVPEGDGFTANPCSRQHELFQNFINLINEHCRSERQLDFYADRLCITKRYLGTIVHEVSGITAKEWIDRAVVTAAKLMLRHTDMSVAQIADELHFPTDSFFCKYFRRLTGCTPLEWRTDSLSGANK